MDAAERHTQAFVQELRDRLAAERRSRAAAGRLGGDLDEAVAELVDVRPGCSGTSGRPRLAELVLRDTVGLGPLEDLLADPAVEEVMVNGAERSTSSAAGGSSHAPVAFRRARGPRRDRADPRALGRRVDELTPMADARLADGSRVNVVIPPLAVDGPALSIRASAGSARGRTSWSRRGPSRRRR